MHCLRDVESVFCWCAVMFHVYVANAMWHQTVNKKASNCSGRSCTIPKWQAPDIVWVSVSGSVQDLYTRDQSMGVYIRGTLFFWNSCFFCVPLGMTPSQHENWSPSRRLKFKPRALTLSPETLNPETVSYFRVRCHSTK